MKYLCLIYQDESLPQKVPKAEFEKIHGWGHHRQASSFKFQAPIVDGVQIWLSGPSLYQPSTFNPFELPRGVIRSAPVSETLVAVCKHPGAKPGGSSQIRFRTFQKCNETIHHSLCLDDSRHL